MKFLIVMFALVAAASCSPVGTFDLPVQKPSRPAVIPQEEVAILPGLPIIASPLPLFPVAPEVPSVLPGLPIIASPLPITPEMPAIVSPVAPILVLPGDNVQVGTFPSPVPEDSAAVSVVESKPLVQIILNIVSDRTAENLVETIQAPSGITKPVGNAPIDITKPILELPVEAPSGITKPVGEVPIDITRPILELPSEAPSGITKPVGEVPIDITRPILELPVDIPALTRPAIELPGISRPATDLIR